MFAAVNGHSSVARSLLAAGATVNFSGPDGRTALHEASLGGFTDLV